MLENLILIFLMNFFLCEQQEVVLTQLKATEGNCFNNIDYKALVREESYFIKRSLGDSIKNEFVCTKLAYDIGIAPKPLTYDEDKSLMVSKFIETSTPFDFSLDRSKERYVSLLQKLHSAKISFPNEFSPFEAIDSCIEIAEKRRIALPEDLLRQVLPKVMQLSEKCLFINKVCCHLDAHSENLLDDGESLYLVDWECAGMCDPLFDLASVSALEDFSDKEMFELLQLYLRQVPSDQDFQKLLLMRIIADARFCTYCFLQTEASSKRATIYKNVADNYLNRCRERLSRLNII